MIRVLIFMAMLCGSALAQDGLHSSRPQGFFGVGHEKWHHVYRGLKKEDGGSCCNGEEGRPTQARFLPATASWQVMVDGIWRPVNPTVIVTNGTLARQGITRIDEDDGRFLSAEAHVFASKPWKAGALSSPGTIFCVILPDSGG